ncbi:hypothetical protein P029_04540 [Anaplasma phagocytophilum str. Norway variant2]|uniref:Uncharacterized protein n=1 Tax=Anaplasma phagocytophilum str. Norway variant2 TaxID=1392507 RepID=A0A168HH63_ANAPH|nr:hypothetical protein [Anaplasma phagocytophilum]ANC34577.1 hypothetical protein P029_04540 [Anaplasma phagocytophilum str. Norway variant2]
MNLYVDVIRAYTVTLIIKNKTKSIRDSGSKEDEADTVYLLAKELAYDVVTGQTDKLSAALAKTSGKDIVQFAKAVEISHSKIGEKVCKTSDPNSYKYGGSSYITNGSYKCGTGHNSGPTGIGQLKGFRAEVLEKGEGWPGSGKTSTDTDDNAKEVAKDLVEKLSSDEKTIVAGLLAKTIEGGDN